MTDVIAVVGSANMDLVWRSPKIPHPGETILGYGMATHPGGKGANQAVAAAKVQGRVQLVACLGRDPLGDTLLSSLKSNGVGTAHVAQLDGVETGTACIVVSDEGQNAIVVAPGANGQVTASRVGLALEIIRPQWVVAQGETPVEAIMAAADFGANFIFNPAPVIELPQEIWAKVWLATPNEHEAEAITGIAVVDDQSCQAACDWFHARGVQKGIITLGSKGVWISGQGLTHAFIVSPVDTTGAGDCFTGSLAAFLAGGLDLAVAARYASAAAALSVTKAGAQESMPSWSQVQGLLGEQGGF